MQATYSIDIRTLILIWSLVTATKALVLVFVSHAQKDYAPARLWALGAISSAAGLFLISFRDIIPPFITIIIGNGLLMSGLMVVNFGVAQAAGRTPPWKAGWIVFAAAIAVLFWKSMIDESTSIRILAFSLANAIYFAHVIFVCLRYSDSSRASSFRVFAAISVPLALLSLWRGAASVSQGTSSLLASTSEQIIFISYYICYQLASATLLVLITNQQLQDKLEHLASTDPLTGLLNRRAFTRAAGREWSRSMRHKYPVSCLMIDIDHFKLLNDQHGHAVGDHVLTAVASSLTATMRIEDILCRYGGEEFVCLLPHTSKEGAQVMAEQLRERIAARKLSIDTGDCAVTISIGVAVRNARDITIESVIEEADRALYHAKQSGRNRVCVEGESG